MSRKKYGKRIVNPRNRLIICLSYGCMGLNALVPSMYQFFIHTSEITYKYMALLGIVLLGMIPVSYFDDREGMQSNFYTVVSCIMHLLVTVLASCLSHWWIWIVYIVEVLIITGIVYFKYIRRNGRKRK